MSAKYPRTPHLPFSPGGTRDDRRLSSVNSFINIPLVITEKMDGSNVCLEHNNLFARSHSKSPNHPSFDALKAVHAQSKHIIPDNTQIFGEWLYAQHSIFYNSLPNYLAIFAVFDGSKWASWEEVELWAKELNVPTVPLLGIKTFQNEIDLQKEIETLAQHPSFCGEEMEGVVIRNAFEFVDFETSVAKFVRANHVQTDDHWTSQTIVKNLLKDPKS